MEEKKEHSQIDFENIHPRHLQFLDGVPDKIREEVMELVTSIPFIYNLVRRDRKTVLDLPKDKQGRVVVNITEPHVFENMDFFRERALYFQKHGRYTDIYPNNHPNSEWMKFWTEEQRRCLEGYVRSDGEWITGEHYWYLNYCPILIVVSEGEDTGKNVSGIRTENFPEFWDGDYLYFHYRRLAREQGLHCNVLKTRRRGYSYKGAAVMTLPYFHMRNQKCYAIASEGEYLYVDGLLNDKTWNMLSFIDNHTPWTQPRDYKDTDDHKRASYKDPATKTERGRKNEIIGVTLKNNTQKARGKAGINVLWEEYGVMPDGLTSWTIALGSMKQGRKVYGQMCSFGTGGTAGPAFEAMETLFYRGDSYDILMLDNVFDRAALGSKCALYIGEYLNREFCYDKNGNSHPIKALVEIVTEWKKRDPIAITQFKADYSITPQDACLKKEGTIFPVVELKEHLSTITPNYRSFIAQHYLGELSIEPSGVVTWRNSPTAAPIHEFPIKDNKNKQGAIEIFKQPVTLNSGGITPGRYIAGCLTPGEKVMTNEGLMNVEDVTLSHKLINKEGDLVDIINLQRYEVKNEATFNIKVSNTFRRTNFTKEHPIYVSDDITGYTSIKKSVRENLPQRYKKLNFEFKKADELKVKQWIKVPNIYKKEIDSTEIPSLIINKTNISGCAQLWWFIGLWLGDGWISRNRISIAFNSKELEYINYTKQIITNIFNAPFHERVRDNCVEISFNNKELSSYLTLNCGLKAQNKRLKEWMKYIPNALKQELLLGYLASDGCISKDSRELYNMEFVSISLELLEDIQDISFSLGMVSSLSKLRNASEHKFRDNLYKTKETYHLRFGHNETIKFAKWSQGFTGTLKLKKIELNNLKPNLRKQPNCGCFIDEDFIYFQITEIQKNQYTGVVYNFECETHTFMCHHITTHNCDPYDDDSSTTNSLGSLLLMDTFTDEIVCEYTGRPYTAEEFYQNVYKVLKYYNATCLYESFNKGLFAYMDKKRSLYLLADNPKILKQMDYIKGDFHGNKAKGYPPSKPVNNWGRRLAADWLVSAPLINDEESPDLSNLHKIRSIGLIKELIGWNSDGNFDRVSALQALMIYREERSKYTVNVEEEVDYNDYFMRNYKPTRERLQQLRLKYGTK